MEVFSHAEDSNTSTATALRDIIVALRREIVQLSSEIHARDEKLRALTREMEELRWALEEDEQRRRAATDRFTQTCGDERQDGPSDNVVELFGSSSVDQHHPRAESSEEVSLCSAGGQRAPLGDDVFEGEIGGSLQHQTPLELVATHTYQAPSLLERAVPRLDLGNTAAGYGGQLSYRSLHLLPSGDYVHSTLTTPTPQNHGGGRFLRRLSLDTPRRDVAASPPHPRFDIDPDGGCGVCQLTQQALAYMEELTAVDKGKTIGPQKAMLLRWLVEDLTKLADVQVGFVSGDEHEAIRSLLNRVRGGVDGAKLTLRELLSRPLVIDGTAAAALDQHGSCLVTSRVVVSHHQSAGDVESVLPGHLWILNTGIALVAIVQPHEVWLIHAVIVLRCCSVRCSRSQRRGRFIFSAIHPRDSGAPSSILQWPLRGRTLGGGVIITSGAEMVNTAQFLVEMDCVVELKTRLEHMSSTCPHYCIAALRGPSSLLLAMLANSMFAST